MGKREMEEGGGEQNQNRKLTIDQSCRKKIKNKKKREMVCESEITTRRPWLGALPNHLEQKRRSRCPHADALDKNLCRKPHVFNNETANLFLTVQADQPTAWDVRALFQAFPRCESDSCTV